MFDFLNNKSVVLRYILYFLANGHAGNAALGINQHEKQVCAQFWCAFCMHVHDILQIIQLCLAYRKIKTF